MATGKGKILVVDDNAGIRTALKILLPPHFGQVELISSPKFLVSKLETFKPDVVLLDMNFVADTMSGNEGLYWTGEIKKISPDTEVVLFTAYADIQLAVEGMRRGAFDFIVKPWENEKLIKTLTSARDKVMKAYSKAGASEPAMYWGDSGQMEVIRRNITKIAPTDATVLITGENGTGKDVLAREIHSRSLRSRKPMVAVDAGAIAETLFESELFGHVKGSFTGAFADHAGKFEQADGSTLFLDEIGNIPLHLQAKLLRALQDRSVTRVGDTKEIPVDIRLICATNMNLEKLVQEGRFREDLYYRINTVHLHLPALRERPGDIVPLAEMFIKKYSQKYHRNVTGLSDEAARSLSSHSWSGNIRELQNCIEKAVILAEGDVLKAADIRHETSHGAGLPSASAETLDQAEERIIRETMARCSGNLSMVAKELNISRPTLYSKLKKYNI